ncbi:aminotransferase class IV [Wandonia haliotis]|uniref:branched-chain-amino-acid transaminase n=1 Tax=Wandonia haliotis TaxID=574963 RepID=A0ABN1MS01_9FLAO
MTCLVNNNGEIIEGKAHAVESSSRAFLYGDGLFESVKVINGKPINIENHFARLKAGAELLKLRLPNYFSAEFFREKTQELIDKSGIKAGGRVRISIDRTSGGAYRPVSNEACYLIEVEDRPSNCFELNAKGLEVDLYINMRKQVCKLSNYKTKNGLLYIMASLEAEERQLDDVLLTNEKGIIIEATSSNLFVVSNGVLYTPGLEDGCLAGTMRMQIINLALENQMKVYECSIMPQNLLVADEVFLTNAVRGVMWVGGYRTKRYMNNVSRKFVDLLNAEYCI